jgi:hypothetical protein
MIPLNQSQWSRGLSSLPYPTCKVENNKMIVLSPLRREKGDREEGRGGGGGGGGLISWCVVGWEKPSMHQIGDKEARRQEEGKKMQPLFFSGVLGWEVREGVREGHGMSHGVQCHLGVECLLA